MKAQENSFPSVHHQICLLIHQGCSYRGEFMDIALQNLTQIPDMA